MESENMKILNIRKPIYKKITHESIDKTSNTYNCIINDELTKSYILNEIEDLFVAGYCYNMKYDINEFLEYIACKEMTSEIYNVLKEYLRYKSKEEIDRITNCKKNRVYLDVLRGELYRIKKILLEEDMNINEESIFGYFTIYDCYTKDFDRIFDEKIRDFKGIMKYVDLKLPEIRSAVLRNINDTIDYLIEKELINNFLEEIEFERLEVEKITKIILSEKSKLEKEEINAMKRRIIYKLKKMDDFGKKVKIYFNISEDYNNWLEFRDFIIEEIKTREICEEDMDGIFDIVLVDIYHGSEIDVIGAIKKYESVEIDEMVKKKIEKYTNETKKDVKGLLFDKIVGLNTMKTNFREMIELYFKYVCMANKNVEIRIEDILEFPEKFFVAGLKIINDETTYLLGTFHSNFFDERTKRMIAKKIERDIFIKYLIKRNIWYDVDFSSHVEIMTDKYKLLYGLSNMKWAAENIDMLRKIGITTSLYLKLDKSEYKNVLNEEDRMRYKKQMNKILGVDDKTNTKVEDIENDENNIINHQLHSVFYGNCIKDNSMEDINNIKNINCIKDNSMEDINNNDICDSKRVKTNNYIIKDEDLIKINDNVLLKDLQKRQDGLNKILKHLHELLKNNEYMEKDINNVSKIENENDYLYVIRNLYIWLKETKWLRNLAMFLKKTVKNYELRYENYQKIIGEIIKVTKEYDLLSEIVISISVEDIKHLIQEYFDYGHYIANGIIKKYNKLSDNDSLEKLIWELINSENITNAYVGIKSYSCIRYKNWDLLNLLNSRKDEIILEALNYIESGKHNDKLLKVILTRGNLDEICAKCLNLLDIKNIDERNRNRIYSLFYIEPMKYVFYECYKYGFSINKKIAHDLIDCLENIYEEDEFENVAKLLCSYDFEKADYEHIINKLVTNNEIFKKWGITKVKNIDDLELGYFVKICWFIANEINVELMKKGIEMLRLYFMNDKKMNEKMKNKKLIDKWMMNKKLERLVRRIYPIFENKKDKWLNLINKCENHEEVVILMKIHMS